MTPLQSELNRLYLPRSEDHADAQPTSLIDSRGQVRAMVMELRRPAHWELLSKVWHGVQSELELPAPAIAVSGIDALQLWFSLAEPVDGAQAHAFLERLRLRFLPEVDAGRVGLMPSSDPSSRPHAAQVPARQALTENWSAFVASDLAPVFGDTPWLDIPPSEEGQAGLLRGLRSMQRPEFDAASKRLMPQAFLLAPTSPTTSTTPATATQDPRRFLLQVMNDDSLAMALRIEAAKALLQHPT